MTDRTVGLSDRVVASEMPRKSVGIANKSVGFDVTKSGLGS